MSRPSVLSAVLIAACASSPPVSSQADAPPPPRECLEADTAEAEVRRLTGMNMQSLEAALSREGLERFTPTELSPLREEGLHGPLPNGSVLRAEWEVFVDAEGRNVLTGPRVFMNCARDPSHEQPRFVRSRKGELLVLDAAPVPRSTREILSCGCPPHVFDGCGAYMPFTMQQLWVVPEGLRFGGIRRVPYDVVQVERAHARQEGCPAPIHPPSAPRGPSQPLPLPGLP